MYDNLDSAGLAEALADEAIADTALYEDGLDDAWDSWAAHWETEFSRLDGLEEQWQKLGADRACLVAKREMEQAILAEAAAKAQKVEQLLEDMRREEARQKLREDATQGRKNAAAEAMEDSDDLVRQIQENAAARRAANAARQKKEREVAREAQYRRYESTKPPSRSPSPAPPKSSGAAGAPPRRPSKEESRGPSKDTRPPPRPRASSLGPGSERRPPTSFLSFEDFDAHWARFEERITAGGKDLRLLDVPWPLSLATVSGVSACESLAARKTKLRAALKRWHPDKWSKLLDCIHESDRAKVVEKVKEVTRKIIDEKKRYGM